MSVSASDIPDVSVLQAIGDRRTIRYYDPARKVEDWKIQTILQAARMMSCQGNINATEAIVIQKETCDLWDEIEECVSGFNVQVINQCSHVIFWLTNLHAWYGRANDGLSSLALSGAATHYHGWNYEFTMTQRWMHVDHRSSFEPNQPASSLRESAPHNTEAGPTSTMSRMISSVPMHALSACLTISTSRCNVAVYERT